MQSIESGTIETLLAEKNIFVLDVRTPREFAGGTLAGAHSIPVDELALRLEDLPSDKDRKILVFCAHGVRSVHAAQLLEQRGYTRILNLRGGLAALYGEK